MMMDEWYAINEWCDEWWWWIWSMNDDDGWLINE